MRDAAVGPRRSLGQDPPGAGSSCQFHRRATRRLLGLACLRCHLGALRAIGCSSPFLPTRPCRGTSMSKRRSCTRIRAALGLILSVWVGVAMAQSSGGSYTLRKQVAVAGGRSASDAWGLSQSLAEPGAGAQSGGGYRLTGGQQTPRLAGPDGLFTDGFESD